MTDDGTGTRSQEVVVVGAGLAGLVVARELRKRGVPVRVLDAAEQTGGKATALRTDAGDVLDHGYHVFPGWYANTRRLLGELGLADGLVDFDRVHYVRKGAFPEIHTLHEMASLRSVWRNLTSGLVSWRVAAVASYYGLDLALQDFKRRGVLDRISANGFLRSRFYRSEHVAEVHQHFVLQASAIPNYEISAMTARRITQAWFRTPSPLLSILRCDMGAGLIEPLEKDVRARGAELELGRRVARLRIEDRSVVGLELEGGEVVRGDVFVLATPVEATHALVDSDLVRAERAGGDAEDGEEKSLARLSQLRTAPMAAFHVFFHRQLPGLPREHTVLYGSPSQISFVDISQCWDGLQGGGTVLSAIASDFAPLVPMETEEAKRVLIEEMREWLHPLFGPDDVDWERSHLRTNVAQPLFLNSVGSWHFRPGTRTRLENLFVAGDYCRTTVDLTTMEGAVESALRTAGHLLRARGLPDDVAFERHDAPLPARFRLLRALMTPGTWLLARTLPNP